MKLFLKRIAKKKEYTIGKLYIDNVKEIDEDLDYEMYKYIEKRLSNRNYMSLRSACWSL